MNVKSNYFKLNKSDFDKYLNDLKHASNTINLLDGKFFFNQSIEIFNMLLVLNKKILELDFIINSFTNFSKKQIIQSFIIDEIESTNKIENIFSTKHDIFKIINEASLSKEKKIISIANAYKYLLENEGKYIKTCQDIRNIYDLVLNDAIEKNDLPDGIYFRHGDVYVANGIKNIHIGIAGEENVNRLMEEFVNFYNSKNDTLIKMILCHFMFEYIQPFYDGNGRLGRFLFSNGLFLETKSYFSFTIAMAFLHEKNKYYKAFQEANDIYEFGCLNTFVESILEILINQTDLLIKKLNFEKNKLDTFKYDFKMTKLEEKIFKLISEASVFSYFGVSNEEIIKETQVSKRTLISTLNKFKEKNILVDTKIGKFDYHKFNL